MDLEKQRAELKKSLLEKGMSEESADEVCKGFPFQKDGEKDASSDDKEDKDKMDKATPPAEESADLDKLAKGLEDLRAQLEKPNGLSEDEVQERIEKALASQVDPIKRHATAVAETADLLVKAQQAGMETLRKGLASLTETVGGIIHAITNPPELLAKSLEQEAAVKDLQAKLADLTKENEDLRKALVPAPKSVASELDIDPHPGDEKKDTGTAWTQSMVLQKALELKVAPGTVAEKTRAAERHNEIVFALSGSSPAAVAKRFSLEG
jgi:hypothetical protein